MTMPSPKNVCSRCQAECDAASSFCGRCGALIEPSFIALPSVVPALMTAADINAVTAHPGPQPAEPEDFWLGRVIDGRYRVLERLGKGGMGLVYKVEHMRMGKLAAMKVLHRELAAEREVVKRFRREAEAVSRLTHPNTVQVFDFGMADGALYLIMEYVRGADLGALLRDEGPMPVPRALELFAQIASALTEAHALGIVHRDLKPENVIITRPGVGNEHAKVLDFGLAKLDEREEQNEVTARGSIVGTPYYMSPEQIRGEPIDQRSDLYSLGAMLYRVTTGEPPFRAPTPVGVLTRHLTDVLRLPSEARPDLAIPPGLDELIGRAMSKNANDRYASADELRNALEALRRTLGGAPLEATARTTAVPTPTPTPTPRSTGPAARIAHSATWSSTSWAQREPSGDALAREDLDAYERSIRRSTLLRRIGLPVVLVALIAGGTFAWRWSQRQPQGQEHEPNQELATATLVAPGQRVTGTLGKRFAETVADRDVFRIKLPHGQPLPARLTVGVSRLPNIDIALAVVDGAAHPLALGDAAGVGEPETIYGLVVSGDAVYITVTQSAEGDPRPIENVSDRYELSIALDAFDADEEREPNDMDSDAVKLVPGTPVHGRLGRLRDLDAWEFAGTAGEYDVTVTGADSLSTDGADLVRLRIGEQARLPGRSTRAKLAPGTVVRVERLDPEPAVGARPLAPGTDARYTLTITPAR